MIRILLVDDQPLVRSALRMRLGLEPDLTVIGEADDGRAALALATELVPDVVLMDIMLPEMDGIDTARTLASASFPPAIVFLTLHDGLATRERASAAGGEFVAKHEDDRVLLATIRRAVRPRR